MNFSVLTVLGKIFAETKSKSTFYGFVFPPTSITEMQNKMQNTQNSVGGWDAAHDFF